MLTGTEPPDEHRRGDRLEVRVAGQRVVQRLQPPGRLEQHSRPIASALGGEHDLRAQPLQTASLELVERSEPGRVNERGRRREVGDVELRLRGGECPLDAHACIRRQLSRPFQERGGRGHPATPLRATGRANHFRGHRFVRLRRRMGAMPGAPVGIEHRVSRVGEGSMHVATVGRVRRDVDRRANERVRETNAYAELDQSGSLGRRAGLCSDPEALRGPPKQVHITHRLGRRGQEQQPRVARQLLNALEEASLYSTRQLACVRESEPACQLGRRQATRQFDQRERIAARLVEDARFHLLVERTPHHCIQEQSGMLGCQPPDRQLRQPREHLLAALHAHREHQRDPLRQEPARHERERLRRHTVKPLRVVHDADQRLVLSRVRQEA